MSKLKSVPKPSKINLKEYAQSKNLSPWNRTVTSVLCAYSDCLPETVDTTNISRSLELFAIESMSIPMAKLTMLAAVPDGYNAFNAERAFAEIENTFGVDALVFIARESSVCLYVKPVSRVWLSRDYKLTCDEFSFDAELGMFRIWWD